MVELTIGEINWTYEDQLWNPDNWTVRSFHDNTGTALANTITAADSGILKTAGSLTVNTAIADLRPSNIMLPASVSTSTSASSTAAA